MTGAVVRRFRRRKRPVDAVDRSDQFTDDRRYVRAGIRNPVVPDTVERTQYGCTAPGDASVVFAVPIPEWMPGANGSIPKRPAQYS